MTKTRLRSWLLMLFAAIAVPAVSGAQVLRVVLQADSALVIATLPACANPCADSASIEWRYGAQYVTRKVPIGATDTVRVARLVANSAYLDSARLNFVQLGGAARRLNIAMFVAPLPAAAPTPKVAATSQPQKAGAPDTLTAKSAPSSNAPGASAAAAGTSNTAPAPAQPARTPGRYVVPAMPTPMSVTYPPLTGQSRRVGSGGDLHEASNTAQSSDEVRSAENAKPAGSVDLSLQNRSASNVVGGEATLPSGSANFNTAPSTGTRNPSAIEQSSPSRQSWMIMRGVLTRVLCVAGTNRGLLSFGTITPRIAAKASCLVGPTNSCASCCSVTAPFGATRSSNACLLRAGGER